MRILLGFLLCLCSWLAFFTAPALAFSRAQMPVAYYTRQADLVIVAHVTKPQAPDYQWILRVREVLKGKVPIGEVITIPQNRALASFLLPYKDGTAAVFLKKGDERQWNVLESRSQPDEVAAVRVLTALLQLPSEREQITGLQKAVRQAPRLALLSSELESVLREMRQPENFDLIEDSLPLLNERQRENMMRALGTMNDLRAVSLLTAALQAPERTIKGNAAQVLAYHYPGAPGVTEAMRAALQDETLKRTAQDYLAKRDASVVIEQPQNAYQNAYLEAQRLLESPRKVEGALAHLLLLENRKPEEYFSYWTAEAILPFLDDDGKARLRRVVIKHAMQAPDYLQAEGILQLLRQMPHAEAIPALLNLLNNPQPSPVTSVWRKPSMLATFLLRDLGPQARQKAIARLLENRNQLDGEQKRSEDPTLFLLQLAWLADDKTWSEAKEVFGASWQQLQPLRAALSAENEGRSLAALLKNLPENFPLQARSWIIYHLGDLHEKEAITPLLEQLPQFIYMSPPAHKEALIEIGGAEVEEGALKLLRHGNSEVRRQAMEILRELRGDKMRPLLRQILSEPDESNFGHKSDAASMMGALGTPEDLPLLLSLSDFWKTDRRVQNWAVSSIASIRERHNYDINGPIQKVN